MCNNESLGFTLCALSKIYAIRIMARGNDKFTSVSEMVFHLLSQHVENANHAQIFALDGDEFIGWNRGKAEYRVVFINTIRGLIINGYGKDAKIRVDAQGSIYVFSDWGGICVKDDSLTNGDKHTSFSDVPTFVKAFHIEVFGIATVDDQVLGG